MANISTLTVSLVANTAKFDNGMKKAKQNAGGFGKAMAKGFKVAAVAVGALAAGLSALIKQSLAMVDQQRKMARVLGTSQATFSGLTLAAGIAGVQMESFNKALKRQQKSIVDASDGLMTQRRAFDRLGLSTDKLINLPVEKQFSEIIRALGEMENQTLKVAAASDIFGARNADLLNVIDIGAEGLDKYIQKTKELGVALTDRQTDAIEKANDAMLVMKTAFSGLGNQLASRFAPAIIRAAEAIESLVARMTNAIPAFQAWLAQITGVQRELDQLTLKDLQAEFAEGTQAINESQQRVRDSQARIGRNPGTTFAETQEALINKELREQEAIRLRLTAIIDEQKRLLKEGEVAAGGPSLIAGGEGAGGGGAATASGIELIKFAPALRDVGKDIPEIFKEAETSIVEFAARAQAGFEATRTPLENFKITLAEIRKQIEDNPFFDEELAERETAAAVEAYLAELEGLKAGAEEATSAISEFAAQAGRNMQDAFADFLFDPFEDGLSGMIKGFSTTLRRMVADLIASKLLKSFFSLFPGLGSAFGFGTSAPGSAIGGVIGRGQTRTVGERGPELFTPGVSGAVRPLGAVTVNSELNINGGGNLDPATLIPILEENNRKVKAELLDAFDRGQFA